jgi:hypothetical protein
MVDMIYKYLFGIYGMYMGFIDKYLYDIYIYVLYGINMDNHPRWRIIPDYNIMGL